MAGGVTTADIAAAGGSDNDSGDSDFFNSSLSIWRGPRSSLEGEYEPVPLDLHTACSIGNFDVVRMYINSEEDLNAKNSGGYTPLMYAAYIGHDNVVNMLIDAQVDVNLSNDKGHSPLMLAASCGNESVCEFLKDAGSNMEAIDKKGWTALFHATFNGHQNLVKFLLERGANINAVEPKYGFTPLMQAAFHGHEIIAQCLLQQGANMELTSRIGDTARSLAMKKGYIKIVSMIDNKALSHVSIRSAASLGSDDSSSDENSTNPSRASRRRHHVNITDGPDAMSSRMKPQNVTFQEPVVTESPKRSSQKGGGSIVGPLQNLNIRANTGSRPAQQTPPYKSAQQGAGSRVMQVSPTPKVSVGRPTNLHELLLQLGLVHYEPKFIEQDVDLDVFLTLSADDLKEIGLDKFGPRRKMTNAIESWHKENAMLSDSGADTSSLSGHVEKLQIELQEKHRQLTQAFQQLNNYHKDLQDEKNIRGLTESYLLAEKARLDEYILHSRDVRQHCAKTLRSHGKVKTIKQLLRARHEEGADIGFIPPRLQETLQLTDETTKKQITVLANKSTTELWDSLQFEFAEGTKSINMAIFNLDKLCADEHAANF